jgi:hypothetical protein
VQFFKSEKSARFQRVLRILPLVSGFQNIKSEKSARFLEGSEDSDTCFRFSKYKV